MYLSGFVFEHGLCACVRLTWERDERVREGEVWGLGVEG